MDKQEIIKKLIAKLGDGDWAIRRAAVQELGSIVPSLSRDEDKQESIDGLIPKLGDDNWMVRQGAAQALGSIVPSLSHDEDKQESIDGLIAQLGHGNWAVRKYAALALGSIVPSLSRDEDKQEIIKKLIAKLGDDYGHIRKCAAQALGSIVPTLHDEQAKKTFLLELPEHKGFRCFNGDALVALVAMANQIKDKSFHEALLSKQSDVGDRTFLLKVLFELTAAGVNDNATLQLVAEIQAAEGKDAAMFSVRKTLQGGHPINKMLFPMIANVIDNDFKGFAEMLGAEYDEKLPDKYKCPITREVMQDPVKLATGPHAFERKEIEEWFKRKHTNPLTNEPLSNTDLTPDKSLKSEIRDYRAEQIGQIIESYRAKHDDDVLDEKPGTETKHSSLQGNRYPFFPPSQPRPDNESEDDGFDQEEITCSRCVIQ